MQKLFAAALALGYCAWAQAPQIQRPAIFETRLAPVAIDAAMKATIAGTGAVTATALGSKLTIEGTFSGLKTGATAAYIYQGSAAGVRGQKILDLTLSPSGDKTSGTISGVFNLTLLQMERLGKGTWYVQLNSEKAPEGNLWGWLIYTGQKQ